MLTIHGRPKRLCDGVTRRDVLHAGGVGLLGTNLNSLLAAEHSGSTGQPRAKSVMFVFLFGGPSQLESFDMKPDATAGIRGPYQPIASRTPGLRICEKLPRLAAISDQFAVIRTVTHPHSDSSAQRPQRLPLHSNRTPSAASATRSRDGGCHGERLASDGVGCGISRSAVRRWKATRIFLQSMSGGKMNQRIALLLPCFAAILCHGLVSADEPAKLEWKYSVDLLRPFWQGTVIHGESGVV